MVVGKKTSKSKKCKPQSAQQHHQQHLQATSSSADCLKDDVPLSGNAVVPRELHENAIELGYNSGDEYDRANVLNFSAKEIDEIEKHFEKKMRKKGFIIKKMAEDGACLFRAVADQIYGDQEMHQALRKLCMDYMAKNSDYFSHYVTEDFNDYVKRKRSNNCHGNHVEIQAMSEMFNRPIEVYHYNCEPINIFQGCNQADSEPIRLSYHQNVHYNSVVDPYKATVGVGLGFPSFKPGLAEKNLLEKAMRISEDHELEKVMLEDKMKMTDWEATNEAIEEQIARESYVEWLKDNERKLSKSKKVKFTATATATTTSNNLSSNSSPKWGDRGDEKQKSPKLSPRLSPKAGSSGLNSHHHHSYGNFVETGTFVNQFHPQMFGMSDCVTECWDDNDILRQVLAQSQQEYLDSLKRKAKEINCELSNEKASSSGLNNYYHESFREGCASGLSGSPSKKLKVNDSAEQLSDQSTQQLNEQVNETVDKTVDKTLEKTADRDETDKEASDNDEKLTRHAAEVGNQAQSEEPQRDKNEKEVATGEQVVEAESIKSDESSKSAEATSSMDRSQDESSKH